MENAEVVGSNYTFDMDNFVSKKYGISFIAYVKLLIIHAFLFNILSFIFQQHKLVVFCLFIAQIIIIALYFMSYRARYVYCDTRGVWYHSGFLPWTKGINGLHWRDFGGALYYTGFFPYILHAYRISINHRFTESSRIFIKDIHNGHEFVSAVNECRDILIQNGKI